MLGDGGENVSIVPVVYPNGTVSVSSLDYFLSVGYYSKTSNPSLTFSFRALHIQEYLKNKRVRSQKFTKSQKEKARHEERMEQSNVLVR